MRTGAWPPMLFSLPRPPIRPAGHAWTRTVAHRRGLLAGWAVPASSFSRHEEHRAHQATGTADKRGWTQISALGQAGNRLPTTICRRTDTGRRPPPQSSILNPQLSIINVNALPTPVRPEPDRVPVPPTPKNHRTPLVPPWNLSRIATFEFRIWTRRKPMGWTGKSRSTVSLEFRPRPARRKCPHPANFPPPNSLSHQH